MTSTTTPLTDMPIVDSPLDPEVADALGNEVLLSATATTKVQKVRRTANTTSAPASGLSRAWTMGGSVD
jgi:hypothetical protein